MITFTITDDDEAMIKDWQENHECKFRSEEWEGRYVGAVGGADTYQFTPTSLGIIKSVTCACGARFDFTGSL